MSVACIQVNASSWLTLSERETVMCISRALKKLQSLTVI